MTSQSKRWWLPRFGLKSLFALVLVAAAYFGSWTWVEERAIDDAQQNALREIDGVSFANLDVLRIGLLDRSTVAPFLLCGDSPVLKGNTVVGWRRRYYLWLFGWTVRLPIATKASDAEPVDGEDDLKSGRSYAPSAFDPFPDTSDH